MQGSHRRIVGVATRLTKLAASPRFKLTGAVLVALLLSCTGIAFASEGSGPAVPTQPATLATSPNKASVELKSARTARSDTFSLPSGERETRIYQAPVNYKAAGESWKPIEEGLQETAGGSLVNGEGPVDVTLPSELQDGATRLEVGDSWVSAKLLGLGTEEAEAEQGTATYENPSKEVSFHYSTVPYGLKEEIELEGPQAPSLFRYQLSASPGLSAELTPEGSIVFTDGKGKAVALIPAPTVSDASSVPGQAGYSLAPGGEGTWNLTLQVDPSWLEQPDRAWPVTIDPTLYGAEVADSGDCQIEGPAYGAIHKCWPNELEAFEIEAAWVFRALLNFNLGGIPAGADIREASLNLYAPAAAGAAVSGVQARRMTTPWGTGTRPSWEYAEFETGSYRQWTTPGGDFVNEGPEILTSERGSQAGWWAFSKGFAQLVQNWHAGLVPNDGLLIKLSDEGKCPSGCSGSGRLVAWDGAAFSEPSKRPYLKVAYWPKAPASSQVVSPKEGTTTAGRLNLKAAWAEAGVTGVTFQYRESKTGFFENIPPELVRKANGEALAKWPVAVSGVHETEPLYLDAAHLSAALRKEGGSVQVRALFEGPIGVEGYDAPVEAKVNRFLGGPKDAMAQVGPGTVDLLTGNLTLSRTDVSVPGSISGLEFSRTFNTRGLGAKASPQETEENKSALGAGWKPSVPVEEAGGSEWRSISLHKVTETIEGENYEFAYATLTDNEGYEIPFEEEPSGAFVTPAELTGWKLARASGTELILSDPAGNRTTFGNLGSGSEYVPTAISQVGSSGPTTRVEYELPEGKKRIHMVVAPTPAGVSCVTQAEATSNAGCHALIFSYLPASSPGWEAPASDGERLAKITYYAPGNGGSWEIANYKYDSNGRLIEEWNPQISPALAEKYTYNAAGQLATITPPGQKPWELVYESFEEEAGGGRLVAAKRDSLVAGTAQTTVAYNVPVSGSGAPNGLGASAISQWGQTDAPVNATAIFPPSEVPTSKPPSAYASATVYYMDSEGFAVNTATPKGGGTSEPSISTAETDEYGNVVRELTPANRLRVLAEPEGKAREERWKALEAKRHYNEQGTQMVEEWGPMHQVRLSSGSLVQARSHKVVQYENPEGLSPNPHLPVRETTGASIPGEGVDADQRVTEYKYKWSLREPTEVIVDPGSKPEHLNITRVTAYDETTGLPIETRQPNKAGEATTPGTTKTIYYKATGTGECEGKPQYANFPCKVEPGAQTSGTGRPELLVKKFLSYNQLGEPTEVSESPGGNSNTRKTIMIYDEAGRPLSKKIAGGGTSVPKSKTLYSSTTGLPTTQQFVCEGECGSGTPTYASTFGSAGSGNGQFQYPSGATVDASGNLWVVDEENNRVEELNSKGEYVTKFGTLGSANGQLSHPTDIAIDAKGNLWVADGLNNRIEEFNAKGEYLSKFGSAGTGNGQFADPEGIAIDAKGNIWVADTYNNRIEKFNEKGEFLKVVGAGQANESQGIRVGPGGNVWVSSWASNDLLKYNEAGEFVHSYGTAGSGNGQFNRPGAIAIDGEGTVWVADLENSRVEGFSQSGEYLKQFGSEGSGAGQINFGNWAGLASDGKGTLWVVDTDNKRVQKWTSTAYDTQATTTKYDALGRPAEYEDADGNVSKTTYDLDGRPVTTSDPKGSQTVTYDPTSGLPTKLEDSAAGTFTASYDADGNLVERGLPDGLTAKTTYNEADEPIKLAYTKTSSCGESCTWLEESLERSINGQILSDTGTLASNVYSYDKAGRLTEAKETPKGGSCTTRLYSYDLDSNRKSLTTRPAVLGACATSGGTTQSYEYDGADRLEGPTYDGFGRITSLPAADAGGHALSSEYFSNEMVAVQTQNGVSNTFQLDATGRQRQRIQGGGLEGTEIFHYDGPSDSPAWTERGTAWTRNITGLGGELAAVQESSGGTTLQLANLHGDIAATAELSPTATKLKSTLRFDEFGNPVSGSSGRFGWLGGKQRRTELASGVIQMGVRSYVSPLGRFLSRDPVAGGSANPYDYANADPVNGLDLDGSCAKPKGQGLCAGANHTPHGGRGCPHVPSASQCPGVHVPRHPHSPPKLSACRRLEIIREAKYPISDHKSQSKNASLTNLEAECFIEKLGVGAPEGGDLA